MTDQQLAGIAAAWWRALQPYRIDGSPNPTANRGALARLRHASVLAAVCEPETFRLLTLLNGGQRDLPDVGLCAAVLASVRENEPRRHPARALGPVPGGDESTAVMSPLRFRRLVEATDPEERLTQLRRAIALAGGTLNVRGLAVACLRWTDTTRLRWIFTYYNAGPAAPGAPDEAVSEETD